MSYIETMNLIDFGTEDAIETSLEQEVKEPLPSETMIPQEPKPSLALKPVSFSCPNATSQEQRRDSLDNNPFDSVQQLANRPDDPFEIVEKEACKKALPSQIPVDVKLGNLLSLSDDNLLDDVDTQINEKFATCIAENNESPKCSSDSTADSNGTSSIYNTANTCNILDSESPPVSMSQKWTTDSGNSSESVGGSASSTDAGNSTKTKKAIEYRKRLLKLSISNSTFNSPVSRRTPQPCDGLAETNNLSIILTEAAQLGEHLIDAESPLKLVDDDLMAEEPNWIDSEKDFDDDLEMLKIPMLKELPSPVVNQKPVATDVQANSEENIDTNDTPSLSDLNAIRAKLKVKRELSNNNQDISLLIGSLKSLIDEINVGDAYKKQQAASLLDTLSFALSSGASKKEEDIKTQEDAEVPSSAPQPQPIVRQGTFDIELKDKKQQDKNNSDRDVENNSHYATPPQSVQVGIRCEEMPDAMIRSSATYDGENEDEKQDLVLPEIQPLTQPQLEVNDIVEQIGKLLEQHQLNNQHTTEAGFDGGASQAVNTNPTFIVVMNTTQAPLTTASVQQHCSYMASCLENSFNDGSPTMSSHSSSVMRRRSQSLSIHDKIKVLQLPPKSTNVIPTASECDAQVYFSPEATPVLQPEGVEFKTPSRMMLRRNSFSSGTSLTPTRPNFGGIAAQRRASGISETSSQMRRSTALPTHHERQRNSSSTSAIVRPMHHLNLNSLKPELTNMKKLRSSTAAESILKSSGPMKATIPVKKVASMLKSSPPIPDSSAFKTKATSLNLNASVQLVDMSGKIPHTSTPMPKSRSAAVALEIAPGLPNACSTPSVRTSPMKRSMINTSRRYSFLSAMPSVKKHSAPSSAAASGLRRRTLCELKSKSPIKPRISNFGGAAPTAVYSSGKTTGASRSSIKVTANAPRTAQNKSAPTPSTKTSSRLNPRTSFAAPTVTKRNKENKQP